MSFQRPGYQDWTYQAGMDDLSRNSSNSSSAANTSANPSSERFYCSGPQTVQSSLRIHNTLSYGNPQNSQNSVLIGSNVTSLKNNFHSSQNMATIPENQSFVGVMKNSTDKNISSFVGPHTVSGFPRVSARYPGGFSNANMGMTSYSNKAQCTAQVSENLSCSFDTNAPKFDIYQHRLPKMQYSPFLANAETDGRLISSYRTSVHHSFPQQNPCGSASSPISSWKDYEGRSANTYQKESADFIHGSETSNSLFQGRILQEGRGYSTTRESFQISSGQLCSSDNSSSHYNLHLPRGIDGISDPHVRFERRPDSFVCGKSDSHGSVSGKSYPSSICRPEISHIWSVSTTGGHPTEEAPFDSHTYAVDDTKEWLRTWEEIVQNDRPESKNLQLFKLQKVLVEWSDLLVELEDIRDSLLNTNCDLEKEALHRRRAESVKTEITRLNSTLKFMLGGSSMTKVVLKRREKRKRQRLKRIEKKKEIRRLKEVWQIKGEQIDALRQNLLKVEKKKLEKEKLQKEVNNVLKDVRDKIADVVEKKKVLSNLKKLRDDRLKKGTNHGYATTPEADAHFIDVFDELTDTANNQLRLYEKEEDMLKTMMTYAHGQKNMDADKSFACDILPENKTFSDNVKMNLVSFEAPLIANEENLDMDRSRTDWDKFLVTSSEPDCIIPEMWVEPPHYPSSEWIGFLAS